MVTPANGQDREQVEELAERMQPTTGNNIELAYVDQGYTGEDTAQVAKDWGHPAGGGETVDLSEGFVLLPRRWMAESSFAWLSRFRHLVMNY